MQMRFTTEVIICPSTCSTFFYSCSSAVDWTKPEPPTRMDCLMFSTRSEGNLRREEAVWKRYSIVNAWCVGYMRVAPWWRQPCGSVAPGKILKRRERLIPDSMYHDCINIICRRYVCRTRRLRMSVSQCMYLFSYLSELQLPIFGKQLAPIFPGSEIDQALERP